MNKLRQCRSSWICCEGNCENCKVVKTATLVTTVTKLKSPTAKWVQYTDVRCSRCGYKPETTGLPRYCPKCGADMQETEQ